VTEPLQAVFHYEADNCPEFELAADPWVRGRRARRTRQIAGVVGGVTALAMGAVVAVGVNPTVVGRSCIALRACTRISRADPSGPPVQGAAQRDRCGGFPAR